MWSVQADVIHAAVILFIRFLIWNRVHNDIAGSSDYSRVNKESSVGVVFAGCSYHAQTNQQISITPAWQPQDDPIWAEPDIPGQYQPWPNIRGH